ncbi:MAG: hypothetical protein WD750_03340 [Gammaproteobacteria bacterium]
MSMIRAAVFVERGRIEKLGSYLIASGSCGAHGYKAMAVTAGVGSLFGVVA